MHPPADLVDGGGAEEEEETEAADTGDYQHHGHTNKERGGLERSRGDGGELSEGTLTRQFPGVAVSDAIVKQAEVPNLRRVHAITNPVRLREYGHIHNSEQNSEDGP